MKTEAEIRQHLADLEWALALPCHCRRKGARYQCQINRERLEEGRDALLWAIGDRSEYRFLVQTLPELREKAINPTCEPAPPPKKKDS